MNDDPLDREPGDDPSPQQSHASEAANVSGTVASQRRILELELRRIRSAAEAARLDAHAAEIELQLRRLSPKAENFGAGPPFDQYRGEELAPRPLDDRSGHRVDDRQWLEPPHGPAFQVQPSKRGEYPSHRPPQPAEESSRTLAILAERIRELLEQRLSSGIPQSAPEPSRQSPSPAEFRLAANAPRSIAGESAGPVAAQPRFGSWSDVRQAIQNAGADSPQLPVPIDIATSAPQVIQRFDPPSGLRPPRAAPLAAVDEAVTPASPSTTTEPNSSGDVASSVARADINTTKTAREQALPGGQSTDEVKPRESNLGDAAKASTSPRTASKASRSAPTQAPLAKPTPQAATPSDSIQLSLDEGEELHETERRGRPAAFVVSALLHVAVLLVLAGWTLASHEPKDQVAFSASTASASEESIETFSIETTEPEVEPTEPTQSETQYDVSPLGEIAVAEFTPEVTPSTEMPDVTQMLSANTSASMAMMVKSTSDTKIQFCGVEGGGNHFVYLVDSSGSMKDGFESARSELVRSIDALKPEQRFYVVFFDAQPDYMRLVRPDVDEPESIYATPANKVALRRWAMTIRQDVGKAPYEPLKFALGLRPDVIFLLSDGEFPQGIEDLLKETNKVENLFGDSGRISIVHTISYFSQEGETRMRRIAEQNGGQYRYIARP